MAFCKGFGTKVRRLLSKIDAELEKWGPIVLRVTTAIKNTLNGPLGDILVQIIPGDLDNRIRSVLIDKLGIAIDYLSIIDTCKGKTGTDKIVCFIEELKKKSPKVRDSLLIKLASILVGMLHSGELKQHEYDTFIQLQYSLLKD